MGSRTLTKSQRYRLRILRFWANEWKTKPSEMERHRSNATLAASKKRTTELNRIYNLIRSWPATFTSTEYHQRIALLASLTARKRASLIKLIRQQGYVSFDANTMLWKNEISVDVVE